MTNTAPRILIVDDEDFIRESLVAFFRDEEFDVYSVETGEDALELHQKDPFKICIMDIRLAGVMDGGSTMLEMKKIYNKVKFLIFTGSLEFMPTPEHRQLGILPEHIVYKPIADLQILLDKIEDLGVALPD